MKNDSDIRANIHTAGILLGLTAVAVNLVGQWVIFPYRIEALETSRRATERIIQEIISTAQGDYASLVRIEESVSWIKKTQEKNERAK